MKKLLILSVAFFAITSAFAQLNLGVKAGLNIANLSGDDADGTDSRISYHFGGYVTFALTDAISLQPELLLNSVGSTYSESGNDPDFGDYSLDQTSKLTYVSVTVMFMYTFAEKFNVQAGPQLSFLASAKSEYDLKSDLGDDSGEEDIEDLKGTDFGFNFGVGANFGKFNAAIRYCLGLSNIGDYDEADLKNNVIQFSVGYKILGE